MPGSPRPVRTCAAAALSAALVVGVAAAITLGGATDAAAATRAQVLHSAGAYGRSHGYTVGISVYDTKTGHLYRAGSFTSGFASESVVKVFIAAKILVQGRMHGTTAKRAYKMITQSDDAIASSLYGSVAGDHLITWVKKHWHVPSLGHEPIRNNWWGSTRITSDGLVRLYAKLKADKKVGPWLLNAMHHHYVHGSDGFNQSFGIPSATSHAAVKQGWGQDFSYTHSNASENTTGYVNSDRYAVAILARGPASTYGSRIGKALTHMARTVLPGGRFPDPYPVVASVSPRIASTAGRQTLTLRGVNFTHVSRVIVGSKSARFTVRSPGRITTLTPTTPSGRHSVRVVTNHGVSPKAWLTFGAPPTVTAMSPASGSTAGGTVVTIRGKNLTGTNRVVFGSSSGTYRSGTHLAVLSSTAVRITTPPRAAARVEVRVGNSYGVSGTGRFTYIAPTLAERRASTPPAAPSIDRSGRSGRSAGSGGAGRSIGTPRGASGSDRSASVDGRP